MNKSKAAILLSAFAGSVALSQASDIGSKEKAPDDKTLIKDITFVVFDTETTGWKAEDGRIIEIGAVKFRDGKVIARKSWLINPGQPVSSRSTAIHGITDSMLEGKPSFKETLPKFKAFTRDAILLAHNASFDVRFMKAEIERNDLTKPDNCVLDTLRLARKWFPEQKSHSLGKLAKALGIETGKLHRALEDSEYTRQLFLMGLKKIPATATLKDLKKEAGKNLSF